MIALFRRVAGHSITHVLFAFAGMGSWAVFSNRAHPMPDPVIAGVVQGMLSAFLTLVLKTIIDRLAERFSGHTALWLPPLIAVSVSACLLVVIHNVSETPEIPQTISLPLMVAASYATIYNYSRWSLRRE
ncbi:hypothetical protein FKG95_09325 [Denitrobaculum tricleocarpae]|uniref:Uncharacterized protein n=1 Tax=Denitrobaculum tricleocarpae TaxID=2591009 RepID=A0A545TUN9_9PROT|nr:hypothetical protein FKG95_09325 [Denitrobaculum tricleocarpae]